MRIVICGAGQVGTTIARHLATRGDNVTVIDENADRARRIGESYDVRAILGHASHPEVLRRAGAQDADMLIAVTRSDDVNMVACQVAYSLFSVKRRVARLRHAGFLERDGSGLFAAEHMPIDVLISPEIEIAESIARRLRTPGAFEVAPFAEGKVALLGIHVEDSRAPLAGERLSEVQSRPEAVAMIPVAVRRKGRIFEPGADYRFEVGDDLYVLAEAERLAEVQQAFGHRERRARQIVIAGAGNIGVHLVHRVRSTLPGCDIKLIEIDRARAEKVAGELGDIALVLNGDALEQELLEEGQLGLADTMVTVTNDDETNIFSAVLAKQAGCKRAIALIEKGSYQRLIPTLGIDSVLDPSSATIATVLRHMRGGAIVGAHDIGEGFGEVVEVGVSAGSTIEGRSGDDLHGEGVRLLALIRGRKMFAELAGQSLRAGDRVLFLVAKGHWPAAEKLFG
ncbi:Trk system potassium transporter TrkA [Pseudogemmobacter humi]|uniref:Trk system potassium uptake protein TrkA n=1 Tax=Pseudogemmobacter humi TaxID=2483812 RepID=A0A3P5XGV8_9RHOB|nr:Trk system potassium transporter TrkA [Pseudogemmobacter humi]VDC34033.1 Trk system potassium uptake protein TrkA [Pseudogemmobacter humi]